MKLIVRTVMKLLVSLLQFAQKDWRCRKIDTVPVVTVFTARKI